MFVRSNNLFYFIFYFTKLIQHIGRWARAWYFYATQHSILRWFWASYSCSSTLLCLLTLSVVDVYQHSSRVKQPFWHGF